MRGRFVYFGKVADDPKGEAAFTLWLDQRDALLAGTLTGRNGHPGHGRQSRTNEYLDQADEARKAVAFAITLNGWNLVAVAGDEIVVEIPIEQQETAVDEMRRVVTISLGQAHCLGELGSGCCECHATDRW